MGRGFLQEDPRLAEMRGHLIGRMAQANLKQKDLAVITGLDPSKLSRRLRHPGDMKYSEYIRIDAALKRRGA